MLRAVPLTVAVLALLAPGPARAAPPGLPERPPAAERDDARKPAPPASLDDLFTRLRETEDAEEAKGVAKLIERRLDRSGSATADLLTERARQAMTAKDVPLAAELMDRVTALEPTWSEGWNRRATVFWLLSDKQAAVTDLQRALVLEPRHFEAWAALGRIYMSMDEKRLALSAFRRATALYPRMPKVAEAIERLAPDVDGRDL